MEIEFNIPVKINIENLSHFSDISKEINDLDLNNTAFIKSLQFVDEYQTSILALLVAGFKNFKHIKI